jgi:hypothetical protein
MPEIKNLSLDSFKNYKTLRIQLSGTSQELLLVLSLSEQQTQEFLNMDFGEEIIIQTEWSLGSIRKNTTGFSFQEIRDILLSIEDERVTFKDQLINILNNNPPLLDIKDEETQKSEELLPEVNKVSTHSILHTIPLKEYWVDFYNLKDTLATVKNDIQNEKDKQSLDRTEIEKINKTMDLYRQKKLLSEWDLLLEEYKNKLSNLNDEINKNQAEIDANYESLSQIQHQVKAYLHKRNKLHGREDASEKLELQFVKKYGKEDAQRYDRQLSLQSNINSNLKKLEQRLKHNLTQKDQLISYLRYKDRELNAFLKQKSFLTQKTQYDNQKFGKWQKKNMEGVNLSMNIKHFLRNFFTWYEAHLFIKSKFKDLTQLQITIDKLKDHIVKEPNKPITSDNLQKKKHKQEILKAKEKLEKLLKHQDNNLLYEKRTEEISYNDIQSREPLLEKKYDHSKCIEGLSKKNCTRKKAYTSCKTDYDIYSDDLIRKRKEDIHKLKNKIAVIDNQIEEKLSKKIEKNNKISECIYTLKIQIIKNIAKIKQLQAKINSKLAPYPSIDIYNEHDFSLKEEYIRSLQESILLSKERVESFQNTYNETQLDLISHKNSIQKSKVELQIKLEKQQEELSNLKRHMTTNMQIISKNKEDLNELRRKSKDFRSKIKQLGYDQESLYIDEEENAKIEKEVAEIEKEKGRMSQDQTEREIMNKKLRNLIRICENNVPVYQDCISLVDDLLRDIQRTLH